MKHGIERIGMLALWLILAATPARAQDDAQREVLKEIESYYSDFSARDWARFADHFWDGATMTTIWQPPGEDSLRLMVLTVPEFVEQAPAGPGSMPIFEERMRSAEVQLSGALAQVWAHYDAKFGEEDNLHRWSGIDAFTLMRFEGCWKIVSLAYASD